MLCMVHKMKKKFTSSRFSSIQPKPFKIEAPAMTIYLTHWGRVTHICVSTLTIIGSDNGLSPDRRQAIIWTNAGILLIRPLGTNFNEILIEIPTFSFTKMRLKVSSAKRRPFCLGLNVLIESSMTDCEYRWINLKNNHWLNKPRVMTFEFQIHSWF